MTTATVATPMSYAEYLALERQSDTKHEYVNGLVYAMAGGSPDHGRLAVRFARLLGARLGDRPREIFSSDVRLRVEATGRSTYPDLSVVCGTLARAGDDPDAIVNPVVVVEVLSKSTEASDRGEKWAHYQRIPSLQEYVLVSQEEQRVEVYRRTGDTWTYQAYSEGTARIESLDASVELERLYHDPLR